MEKDRGARVIAIVALLVGVVGLSVGFAAMSSTLNINSTAEVNPDENDFTVQFSTNQSTIEGTTVSPTTTGTGATAEAATISNGVKSSTISGLHANFTEPGQTATYTFYAVNGGKYTAYLNSIAFGDATGAAASATDKFKVCTKGEDTAESTVNGANGACNGISLKISVGTLSDLTSTTTSPDLTNISGHSLAPFGSTGNGELITVTITYADDANRADGDFDVTFGDITLTYGAVD